MNTSCFWCLGGLILVIFRSFCNTQQTDLGPASCFRLGRVQSCFQKLVQSWPQQAAGACGDVAVYMRWGGVLLWMRSEAFEAWCRQRCKMSPVDLNESWGHGWSNTGRKFRVRLSAVGSPAAGPNVDLLGQVGPAKPSGGSREASPSRVLGLSPGLPETAGPRKSTTAGKPPNLDA